VQVGQHCYHAEHFICYGKYVKLMRMFCDDVAFTCRGLADWQVWCVA